MIFNKHSALAGQHAFLSPSSNAWTNYDLDKLTRVYHRRLATLRGNELHALAAEMIRLKVKSFESQRTFNAYVNDAISFRMEPEVTLVYSENCFGTADAISYHKGFLRIHDLKTGEHKASMQQLRVYAAIFCLEYGVKPFEVEGIELRIYQNDQIFIENPEMDDIMHIMDTIKVLDKRIKEIRSEVNA